MSDFHQNEIIAQQKAEIAKLKAELADKDEDIKWMKEELEERDEAIEHVNDTLGREWCEGDIGGAVTDICEHYTSAMVSEKILGAYNKFINEGQGWEWFIYEISDEDKQMFLDAGLPDEDFD